MQKYDQEIVRHFIRKEKQERCLYLLVRPNRRATVTHELYDLDNLKPEVIFELPKNLRTVEDVYAFLIAQGATDETYVISAYAQYDGQFYALRGALKNCFQSNVFTLVYCFKSKICYYETDGYRCYLRLHPIPD